MGKPLYKMEIDHINGDKLDNRRTNLRIVTPRQNQQNKKIHINGHLPGTHQHKGKWQARIWINKKSNYLGTFSTPQEASAVYQEAIRSNLCQTQ